MPGSPPRSPEAVGRVAVITHGKPGTIGPALARLEQVARALQPAGLRLVLWDTWRPVPVQRALYDDLKAELRARDPRASEAQLDERTHRYVSLPSGAAAHPSPHLTGGAVDLTLGNGSGHELPMGTPFDDFAERAGTRYLEIALEQGRLREDEREALRNRRLLFHLMTRAGFTNYPDEWWHFDYGNQFWAAISGAREAVYGPAAPAAAP